MSGEKLGTWALIAGIVSAVISLLSFILFIPYLNMCICLIIFIGGLVALSALILGIVSLVKGAGDKKKSAIIGIILGGLYWIVVGIGWFASVMLGMILGFGVNFLFFIISIFTG